MNKSCDGTKSYPVKCEREKFGNTHKEHKLAKKQEIYTKDKGFNTPGLLASNAAASFPSPLVPSEGIRGEGNKAAALEATG